jgi:hypothetical protein
MLKKKRLGFARTPLGQRHRAYFRPTIEGLETRDCPSTTVGLVGNTLNIVGDNSADNVQVTLRDNINDIQVKSNPVTITLPGGGKLTNWQFNHFSSTQVQNININLNGGDDNLRMQMGDPVDPFTGGGDHSGVLFDPKNISINLGEGANQTILRFGGLDFPNRVISTNLNVTVTSGSGKDDVIASFGEVQSGTVNFNAFLGGGDDYGGVDAFGNIDTGAALHINLQGQDGNDNLQTREDINHGYNTVDIAAGALLDINVGGGAGNDTLYTEYGGAVLGKLRIRQDGGDGLDGISGKLHLPQTGSTGAVDTVFMGGSGFDILHMEVYGQASAQRALIDGGGSFDFATSVGDVQIINANEPQPVFHTNL